MNVHEITRQTHAVGIGEPQADFTKWTVKVGLPQMCIVDAPKDVVKDVLDKVLSLAQPLWVPHLVQIGLLHLGHCERRWGLVVHWREHGQRRDKPLVPDESKICCQSAVGYT